MAKPELHPLSFAALAMSGPLMSNGAKNQEAADRLLAGRNQKKAMRLAQQAAAAAKLEARRKYLADKRKENR